MEDFLKLFFERADQHGNEWRALLALRSDAAIMQFVQDTIARHPTLEFSRTRRAITAPSRGVLHLARVRDIDDAHRYAGHAYMQVGIGKGVDWFGGLFLSTLLRTRIDGVKPDLVRYVG